MIKQVGQFEAKDKLGKSHTILTFQEFIEKEDLSGRIGHIPGMPNLQTMDGKSVNRIGKGNYQILDGMSAIDLTSTDPNAV